LRWNVTHHSRWIRQAVCPVPESQPPSRVVLSAKSWATASRGARRHV
jgi:hypothetical protein